MKKSLKALLAAVLVAALLAGSVTAFAEDGAAQEEEPSAGSYAGEVYVSLQTGSGTDHSAPGTFSGQTVTAFLSLNCSDGLANVSGQVSTIGLTHIGGEQESFSLDANGATVFNLQFTYTITAAPGETISFSAKTLSATAPDGKPVVFNDQDLWTITLEVDPKEAPTADKSALEAAVNKARALKEEDYTSRSWHNLTVYLKSAEEVLPDAAASQYEVNDELYALESAIEGLVPYVDVSDQAEALRAALARLEAMDQSALSERAKRYISGLKSYAEEELAYPRPDADYLKSYAEEINAIVDGTFQKADLSALAALLEKAKALKEEDYTNSSWSDVSYYIRRAEDTLTNPSPYEEQEYVDQIYKGLDESMKALVPYEPVDQALLDQLLELRRRALAARKGDYPDNVVWQLWYAAGESFYEGQDRLERPDKAAIEEWIRILTSLLEDGKNPVNYNALSAIVAKAEGLNPGDYTDESWGNLINAIYNGQSILRNKDAAVYLQREVDAETARITAAVNALVKLGSGAVDPGKDEVPKTGDPLMDR